MSFNFSLSVLSLLNFSVPRHYRAHGLTHMFTGFSFADPKLTVSDDFFALGKLGSNVGATAAPVTYLVGEAMGPCRARRLPARLAASWCPPSAGHDQGRTELDGTSGRSDAMLPAETIVIACGFSSSASALFPIVAPPVTSPPQLYLGTVCVDEPRLCFVGLLHGEGVFSNPMTMRAQAQVGRRDWFSVCVCILYVPLSASECV